MSFLPATYEAPKSQGSYMKLQDGENRIRILTQCVFGWEDWTLDKKPVRYRMDNKPEKSIDPKKPIRHFWVMVVWNYKEECLSILEITQATVRERIQELSVDTDWGQPFGYDLKIIKSGKEILTKYVVNPMPHKSLDPSIKEIFMEKPINLEAFFDNTDPFSDANQYNRALGFWESAENQPTPQTSNELTIAPDMVKYFMDTIKDKILPHDPEYLTRLLKVYEKNHIKDISISKQSIIAKNIDAKVQQIAKEKLDEEIPF